LHNLYLSGRVAVCLTVLLIKRVYTQNEGSPVPTQISSCSKLFFKRRKSLTLLSLEAM